MTTGAPELYPRTLIDAIASAPERISIVLGGPHMGTTTVLAAVQQRMRLKHAVSARREPEAARRVIAAWSDGQSDSICIDNVDVILGELQVQKHLIAARQGHAVLGGFFSIDRVRTQYRTEAARAHDAGQDGVLSPTDLWWQKANIAYLNPWGIPRPNRPHWDRRQADLVEQCLDHDLRRFHTAGNPVPLVATETIRSAALTLVRVAGGHPMLVGRGYQKLFGWLVGSALPEPKELEESLITALNNDSFDTFVAAARAVLRETEEGFAALLDLVENPAARPQHLHHADLLRASGLVREGLDRSGTVWELVHPQAAPAVRYVAPPASERTTTLDERSRSARSAATPRVRIRPDPRRPDASGSIERADDGSAERQLDLPSSDNYIAPSATA